MNADKADERRWKREVKSPRYGLNPTIECVLDWLLVPELTFFSWIGKHFPPTYWGFALGILAIGATAGLWLTEHLSPGALFWIGCSVVALVWLFALYCFLCGLRRPRNE
jgi:hypothetical protein